MYIVYFMVDIRG